MTYLTFILRISVHSLLPSGVFHYKIYHKGFFIQRKELNLVVFSFKALRPQPQNCGGCPFLHLDNSQLSSLVSKNEKITQIQLEAILRASNDANPSLSCELYLAASTHKHSYKRRQLLRSISYSSVEKRPRSSLMRKTFSSVHPHENSASIKEICLTCSSNVINPDVSFLSPVVYYHLRVLNNNNKPKI